MKRILVLGAGKSSPALIQELLEASARLDAHVVVADLDEAVARSRLGGHPRGQSIRLDITDEAARRSLVASSAIVVSLLAPSFHHLVAEDCLSAGVHLVTASYRDAKIHALHERARDRGLLILSEMGLDPGIDHISALALLNRLRSEGAEILGFRSYGSGIADPLLPSNPLGYVITWNPRNVVLAGQAGAQFRIGGRPRILPGPRVLEHTWPVTVDGVGVLEAYANRDSSSYEAAFGVSGIPTFVRGTLRPRGFCEVWSALGRLGLTNETMRLPGSGGGAMADILEQFVPATPGRTLRERVAAAVGIHPSGLVADRLEWLGLFDRRSWLSTDGSPADLLTALIEDRLRLSPTGRDLVILQHEITVRWPDGRRNPETLVATLLERGVPGGTTAMARTVGLPAAIAAVAILEGDLRLTGSLLPTEPAVADFVLPELERRGLRFAERWIDPVTEGP